MRAIPLKLRHSPGFHIFCRISSNEVNRQLRGFRRSQPSLIVLRFDDERAAVMKRLENLIRIRRNDAEAFDDDLVVVVVRPLPPVPDPPKGEEAIIRKRYCPRLAELLLFLLFGEWLPFEEETGWDEVTTVLPWFSPCADTLKLLGSCIDGAEIRLWCLSTNKAPDPTS